MILDTREFLDALKPPVFVLPNGRKVVGQHLSVHEFLSLSEQRLDDAGCRAIMDAIYAPRGVWRWRWVRRLLRRPSVAEVVLAMPPWLRVETVRLSFSLEAIRQGLAVSMPPTLPGGMGETSIASTTTAATTPSAPGQSPSSSTDG